jgi:hypothetical protein
LKISQGKSVGGVAQVVECLLSYPKNLNSKTNYYKKRKKKQTEQMIKDFDAGIQKLMFIINYIFYYWKTWWLLFLFSLW